MLISLFVLGCYATMSDINKPTDNPHVTQMKSIIFKDQMRQEFKQMKQKQQIDLEKRLIE